MLTATPPCIRFAAAKPEVAGFDSWHDVRFLVLIEISNDPLICVGPVRFSQVGGPNQSMIGQCNDSVINGRDSIK